ncbi:MAG: response regulator [Lachnospiraceae bacterium]|nr:response regulator [Lachnospiraceae bacterium]
MVTWFYFIVFALSLIMTGSFLVKSRNVDALYILFYIFVTVNCLGRYLLAVSESLDMAIWSNRFMYVGGCYAPLLTVMVLARLCNFKFPKWLQAGLGIYSTVVLVLVVTTEKTGLYYVSSELARGDGFTYLSKVYGPLHILYPVMMGLYAVLLAVFVFVAVKNRGNISVRLVMTISLIGAAIMLTYILERIVKTNISYLAIGYLVALMFMNKYFERVKMYDMTSNVSGVLQRVKDYGYLVFDNEYCFVNANGIMKKLFPEIEHWVIDKQVPASDSSLYKEVLQCLYGWSGEENDNRYVQVGGEYYQFEIRRLSYGRKREVGYLLEFMNRTMEKKFYNAMEAYNTQMEQEVERKTEEIREQQKNVKELFLQTVTALSEAVEAKDRYTSGHSKRVAEYARMIAVRMGKSRAEQDEIYQAGLLHDVGKIRIPEGIINKTGKLTDEEYAIIKIHTITGFQILRVISNNSFIAVAAKYHHERYDGKGYPNGLKGEKIPEVARILGVADSYDAMTSNRSYRKALPQEVVRAEIEKGRGTQFDPAVAEIMLQLIDEDKEYRMQQNDSMQRSVLVVDDEPMNHMLISHMMKDEPMYEIVSAGGGLEALELLEQKHFDLILLDVKMPEMDGMETLQRIREKYKTPVVFMTGDKNLDIPLEYSTLAYDDYITKPVLPLLMKEIVHNLTERANV